MICDGCQISNVGSGRCSLIFKAIGIEFSCYYWIVVIIRKTVPQTNSSQQHLPLKLHNSKSVTLFCFIFCQWIFWSAWSDSKWMKMDERIEMKQLDFPLCSNWFIQTMNCRWLQLIPQPRIQTAETTPLTPHKSLLGNISPKIYKIQICNCISALDLQRDSPHLRRNDLDMDQRIHIHHKLCLKYNLCLKYTMYGNLSDGILLYDWKRNIHRWGCIRPDMKQHISHWCKFDPKDNRIYCYIQNYSRIQEVGEKVHTDIHRKPYHLARYKFRYIHMGLDHKDASNWFSSCVFGWYIL